MGSQYQRLPLPTPSSGIVPIHTAINTQPLEKVKLAAV